MDSHQMMGLTHERWRLFLEQSRLGKWTPELLRQIQHLFSVDRDKRLIHWLEAIESLPELVVDEVALQTHLVGVRSDTSSSSPALIALRKAVELLEPWRKGPFKICELEIETEWRSDWKWNRLVPHISPLLNRVVLDVGCGSGYHCWRMRGAGARSVVGLEPSLLFCCQFLLLQNYILDSGVQVLPLRLEDFPDNTMAFDSTFSMGVLYHRKSPFDHLARLRSSLRPGGELILETLVVDGPLHHVLVPSDRYAQMRNVWFLPSALTLEHWLKRAGFVDVRVVDVNDTSVEEQRKTRFMTGHSLADFLDPVDASRTIEGYPAPKRAILVADRPS